MLSIYEKDVLDGLKGLSKGKDKVISSLPKVKIVSPEADGDSSYLDSFLDRVNSIDSRNVKLASGLVASGGVGFLAWKHWDKICSGTNDLIAKFSKNFSKGETLDTDEQRKKVEFESQNSEVPQEDKDASAANTTPQRPATPYRDANDLQKRKQDQEVSQGGPGITTANGQEYSYWPNIFG